MSHLVDMLFYLYSIAVLDTAQAWVRHTNEALVAIAKRLDDASKSMSKGELTEL